MSTDYRPISEEEFPAYWSLDGYAFREQYQPQRYTPEIRSRLRGLFVDGQLVAQLEILPLNMELGGKIAAIGGIGGVAVDPGMRRRGFAEELLSHAINEMRQRGMALSLLQPFKRSFYSKYGWGTANERRVYSGAPDLFRSFRRRNGQFESIGDDLIDDLDQVYRGALRGRCGPIVRDRAWWQREVFRDWGGRHHRGYLWRDEQGRARSYLIYKFDYNERNEYRLNCREIVALDHEARSHLFAFLGDHDSQVREIRFAAPPDAPVNALLPDPLECRIEPYFMLRLLDVAAALQQYPFAPQAKGELRLAVTDPWLFHNQAVYRLSFADGQAQVDQLPPTSPADLACDVGLLAQFYGRVVRPRTAAAFGLLMVNTREALGLFDSAFSGLAGFASDYF